jgi:RNA polymerase sigma-70 factor (ECF subfamily)
VPSLLQRLRPQEQTSTDVVEDARLVADAQADLDAFAALYDRHFAGVYGYCYRELGSAERAEDATQQVFAQALGSLPRYREAGKFRSWLYAIAFRVIQSQLSADRTHAPLAAVGDISDPDHSPEDEALAALERRALQEAIDRLPRDQRRVIELRIAGLKGREIAAELNRSHEAVRMLQQRALDRLAADLVGHDHRRGGRYGA